MMLWKKPGIFLLSSFVRSLSVLSLLSWAESLYLPYLQGFRISYKNYSLLLIPLHIHCKTSVVLLFHLLIYWYILKILALPCFFSTCGMFCRQSFLDFFTFSVQKLNIAKSLIEIYNSLKETFSRNGANLT